MSCTCTKESLVLFGTSMLTVVAAVCAFDSRTNNSRFQLSVNCGNYCKYYVVWMMNFGSTFELCNRVAKHEMFSRNKDILVAVSHETKDLEPKIGSP